MRRRLSLAYLLQLFLVITLLSLLVYLVSHGAGPATIALVFLGGSILAALPSILAGGVLPARDARRAERIRRSGAIAIAEVLTDPQIVYTQFKRGFARYRTPQALVEVPVRILSSSGNPSATVHMLAPLSALPSLLRNKQVQVRLDPQDPAFVVLDEDLPLPI